jgi:hypothetical protein
MSSGLNFMEKIILELDMILGKAFCLYEFGRCYRKKAKGLYIFTPTQRKEIAIISLRAANPY